MDFQGGSPIGRNVARYRKAAGLSAAELADATGNGLTRSVIANLENDRKDDITVKQLMALSRTLSVPPVALLADLFDPGALSAYPVPSAGKTRNAELIQWVGGHTAQPVEPEKAPAGKLAADALGAVRRYFTAVQWFRSCVTRYSAVREAQSLEESEEKDFQEQQLQYAAESVFGTIEAMQAIGVKVEPYVPAEVHKKLASVGKTYEPIVNDDPFRDFPPPPAPF